MTILKHDFGMFEGYSFAKQGAIVPNHSAQDVMEWDHNADAVEFWPCGDHEGVALVFYRQTAVSAADLIHLDDLLTAIGNDTLETYARIHWLVALDGYALNELTADRVNDLDIYYVVGDTAADLSQEAATQLFATRDPEQHAKWQRDCPGQPLDTDAFWSTWTVREIELSTCRILMAREW